MFTYIHSVKHRRVEYVLSYITLGINIARSFAIMQNHHFSFTHFLSSQFISIILFKTFYNNTIVVCTSLVWMGSEDKFTKTCLHCFSHIAVVYNTIMNIYFDWITPYFYYTRGCTFWATLFTSATCDGFTQHVAFVLGNFHYFLTI